MKRTEGRVHCVGKNKTSLFSENVLLVVEQKTFHESL